MAFSLLQKLGRPNEKGRWAGVLLAAMVGLAAILFLLPLPWTVEAQPYSTSPITSEIVGTNTVEQSFVANSDGLSGIDVLVGTNARQNNSDLTMELFDAGNPTEPLRSVTVSASQLADNQFHRFEFDPIYDSAGRAYRARWQSADATAGNAVTFWAHRDDILPQGAAYVGGQRWTGDLAFSLGYRVTPASIIEGYIKRMSNDRPGVWSVPYFYLTAGFLYVASTLVYLYLVFRYRPRRQPSSES